MTLSARRIDHVVLRVADIDRSVSFYRELLGAEPELEEEFRAGRRSFMSLRIGEALIDLIPSEDPGAVGPKGLAHICIEVEGGDPETVRRSLEDRGVLVESSVNLERLGAKGAGPSLYLTDPDGYRIELKWYR